MVVFCRSEAELNVMPESVIIHHERVFGIPPVISAGSGTISRRTVLKFGL